MGKIFKQKKGITLIALVITIIVLLILAGISISMLSGDNSILQKATTAKESTDSSQIQERINLAYHSSLVDGQGKVTEPSLEDELKKEFNKTTLDEGWLDKSSVEGKWKITINDVSLDVPTGIEQPPEPVTIPTGIYNEGQEIEIGGEKFFVIADDGNSIRVLAKYCLNKIGTEQLNGNSVSETERKPVKTNYWNNISGITYPYDLQTKTMIEKAEVDGNVRTRYKKYSNSC